MQSFEWMIGLSDLMDSGQIEYMYYKRRESEAANPDKQSKMIIDVAFKLK
jgi:hypothetical protein